VGRGPIVDEQALAEAIDNGEIAGAGIDVFVKEPLSADNPLMNSVDKDKIVMTPHIAWASVEARTRLVMEVTENLKAYVTGEKRNVVNPLQ
jgi:glycerate dehydrogenase